MKKKVLIIGYGSIGERHATILSKLRSISQILIFTKRTNIKFKFTKKIEKIISFNPDYIFVCSETAHHFNHIKMIDKNFKNKIVLVEKPLFHKYVKINFKNNKYFVGYNLRFHPVLKFIKEIIKKKKIFSINVNCSSYLPDWRPKRNYKKIYSSVKKRGGGVLLDLSHELDYLQWLVGKITKIESAKIVKISKLKINVEDSAVITGKANSTHFSINMNFFSRSKERSVVLDSDKFSIKGDLLNNKVQIFNDKKKTNFNFTNKKFSTYLHQNKNLLQKNFKNFCTFTEGLKIIKLIKDIKHAG